MEKKNQTARTILSIFLGILSLLWIYPVVMILINSLKDEKYITTGSAFVLPNASSFTGLANYVEALGSQGFATAFGYVGSTYITVYFNVCMVHNEGTQPFIESLLRSVRFLNGSSLPDAHVYPVINSRQAGP